MEDRFPERQGAGGAAQDRGCLAYQLRRRWRLWRAVRAPGRGRARGRAARLCVGAGGGGALRRRGRRRDLRGRSGGDRQTSRQSLRETSMADVVQTNPPTMAPPGGHYSHAVTANGFVFV